MKMSRNEIFKSNKPYIFAVPDSVSGSIGNKKLSFFAQDVDDDTDKKENNNGKNEVNKEETIKKDINKGKENKNPQQKSTDNKIIQKSNDVKNTNEIENINNMDEKEKQIDEKNTTKDQGKKFDNDKHNNKHNNIFLLTMF